jgi:hypothetical protein
LIHESQEKNDRFQERFGLHARCNWDDERSTLKFSDPEKIALEIDVSIVGSTEGNSWEWAWANANIPPENKINIEKVRELGEAQGYEKLTTAFLEADEYTGWEMTAVAPHVLNAPGSYRFPTDRGYCYLVYRNIREITVQ